MLAFLYLNGFHLDRSDKDIEDVVAALAAKGISKDDFFLWVERALQPEVEDNDDE